MFLSKRISSLKLLGQSVQKPQKKFSIYQNPKEIVEFLSKTKVFNEEQLNIFRQLSSKHKKIHFYRLNWFFRTFFVTSRLQIYAYCLISSGYCMYTLAYKYNNLLQQRQEGKIKKKRFQKQQLKMILLGCGLIVSGICATYLSRLMGRRVIKDIYYLPAQNQFELRYFNWICMNHSDFVEPHSIIKTQTKRMFDKTIEYERIDNPILKNMSTKGPGAWSNKALFEYLISQKQQNQQEPEIIAEQEQIDKQN